MVLAAFVILFFIIKPQHNYAEREEDEDSENVGFDKPDGFIQFYKQITTPIGQLNNSYTVNYSNLELKKALKRRSLIKSTKSSYVWTQRGPGNVSGRTRSVIVDPDDTTHNTWFAAAVSGGIWKTTDGGESWENLTDNQLTELSTCAMAMAFSNHSVIYAGTGEGYGGSGMVTGNGIYKTTDKGITWNFLNSTLSGDNFKFVNKIIVDPTNADIVVAATNTGIFKSTDGGKHWVPVFKKGNEVQDLSFNPLNPRTIYAAVNGIGIIKSYNEGNSWNYAYNGIGFGKRFALTVSQIDTNYVFTSVEAPNLITDVYISVDGSNSWRKLNDFDNTFTNFLGNQGWFNNVIKNHPFNKNIVFIGGVNLGSIEFKSSTNTSAEQVMRVDTFNLGSFMQFVNFGGLYFDGAMSTGIEEGSDVTQDDFVSVEIRFGPGISQKAYRFTVPTGQGAGVPYKSYSYMDYTEVPFQAWDIKNNKQLMISFRDQERDGKFNLIKRTYGDDISGREYLFVHSVQYKAVADTNIAKNGGEIYKMLYFFWPTLPDTFPSNKTWDGNTLPASKISVQYGSFVTQDATTTVLADDKRNNNLHVDHHFLDFIITDSTNSLFTLIDANDGGLGLSTDEGLSWKQIKKGYITTQFYGVAKKPGAQEYIGGMQDNGTWQSAPGETSVTSTEYSLKINGDGFEALWHPDYPQRILGSSYNNKIKISLDGGVSWDDATNGINDNDGPFITRLSNSVKNPNLVFAVGNYGVFRHTNFAVGRFPWQYIKLGHGWAVNDEVTSSHNVKVSLADPKIVWAGEGMYSNPDLRIFLSKDYGLTFDSVKSYRKRSQMGYITSIATHPTDTGTAYLLFSMKKYPKILRTTDYGETWEDITGFDTDTSSNGFPDVMVYSLLVLPDNSNTIWAGTEIGIFELTNGKGNWHLVDHTGLPPVSVWQMFVQDNSIIIATHGRGIWSTSFTPSSIDEDKNNPEFIKVFPNPTSGIINISLSPTLTGNINIRILDESGRLVRSFKDFIDFAPYNKQLDLSSLDPGNYIVNMTCKGNNYNAKVILK